MSTDRDALPAFLSARLDEDERIAHDADGIPRDALLDLYEDLIKSRPFDDQRRVFGIHISHFTSGRMLWDIAAKRGLLHAHQPTPSDHGGVRICAECSHGPGEYYQVSWPCLSVRLLALPYAGHGDYRKEWRP